MFNRARSGRHPSRTPGRTISETGTFWMFAVFGALGFVFLLRALPETKGRSLEEIDADLRRRASH